MLIIPEIQIQEGKVVTLSTTEGSKTIHDISPQDAVKKFADGIKVPVLVFTGNGGTLSKETRRFSISKKASEPTLAEAVVAKGLAHKIIVNFLVKLTDIGRPMKMFSTETEAVAWLKTFKPQTRG